MEVKAIKKAGKRLAAAKAQLEIARSAQSYEEFEDAWYFFLVAAKSVQTTLRKGSHINPQSRQWFGGKMKQRKADPLLQYFYHARDDDEHGLDPVTGKMVKVVMNSESRKTKYHEKHGYVMVGFEPVADTPPISFGVLGPVKDRGGVVYAPPQKEIEGVAYEEGAVHAASLLLNYLEGLLIEAGERAA